MPDCDVTRNVTFTKPERVHGNGAFNVSGFTPKCPEPSKTTYSVVAHGTYVSAFSWKLSVGSVP